MADEGLPRFRCLKPVQKKFGYKTSPPDKERSSAQTRPHHKIDIKENAKQFPQEYMSRVKTAYQRMALRHKHFLWCGRPSK